jgi:REP element-mobilizing transposase RayT
MTSVPSVIRDLVERFERNRDSYVSSSYNETQLRREFLDPFFTALGWDVDNQAGLPERYKEVIHEDSIRVTESESHKAPDYCFRIGGTRKFFVEAKRPWTDLLNDCAAAFQIRRYAFSAKLPLSILTNFKDFVVYDCRFKPVKDDPPNTGRILFVNYTKYLNEWEKITGVFSRDAIWKGAFDKYAESTTGKKGTAEVDDEILKEIEGWREELAHNIALRNSDLTVDELNTAVSRTIDRILFLRVCEDRGTESDDQLKNLLKSRGMYARLFDLFQRADQRYNSGLFHFSKETGRGEAPDTLTPKLKVDDTPLKGIIRSLYYPDCPYVWSQIPADILGQVYEQFLGKVIRLTKGHQAKVEDKPEVKKAGGVYYTPTYIVDYIVQHTVGKLLEGKTPKEAAKLRILDPACGSGSFLIGAYQHLLDWYLEAYLKNTTPPCPPASRGELESPSVHGGTKGGSGRVGTKGGSESPSVYGGTKGGSALSQADKKRAAELPIYQVARNEWRLSLAERKRILLDHIYGVDIDAQAVEVTKLSLLLKVLEGETQDTLESELKLRIRALPDLAANIKCGNSLIGTDFYEFVEARGFSKNKVEARGFSKNIVEARGFSKNIVEARGFSPLSEEDSRRINPFDWQDEFKEVFSEKGRSFWLVTFVTHNARVSDRMVEFGVQKGEPLIFTDEERERVADILSALWKEYGIPVVAGNVLSDHVHLVMAAENETELDEHVRKLKGASAYRFSRDVRQGEGGHVWQQKFNRKPLTTERALHDAQEYVWNNHLKHDSSISGKGLQPIEADKGLKPPCLTSKSGNGLQQEQSRGKGLQPIVNAQEAGNGLQPIVPPQPLVNAEEAGNGLQPLEADKGLKPLASPLSPLVSPSPPYLERLRAACTSVEDAATIRGGFDAVIGNPPYLNMTSSIIADTVLAYYDRTYSVLRPAQSKNLFSLFIEKGISLIKQGGRFGFIVPEGLARTRSYATVRKIINEHCGLESLLFFEKFVFPNATIGSVVFIVRKGHHPFRYSVRRLGRDRTVIACHELLHDEIGRTHDFTWREAPVSSADQLVQRIAGLGTKAGTFLKFYKGMVVKGRSRNLRQKPKRGDRPFLLGNCMGRYRLEYRYYTSYNELDIVGGTKVLEKHLEVPRVLVRRTGDHVCATLTDEAQLVESTIYIVTGAPRSTLVYVLGLLNCQLITFLVRRDAITNKQAYPQILMTDLQQLPIRTIDFSDKKDKARHDKMVSLVEKMLELNKDLQKARTDTEQTRLKRQIAATDKQIDQLVYELYGLTEEEIRIVEGTEGKDLRPET